MSKIEAVTKKDIRKRVEENPAAAATLLVELWQMLGSNFEWSMEHNFDTTEAIAALADEYMLPSAYNQSDAEQRFWEGLR
jgi:hypothetical protein